MAARDRVLGVPRTKAGPVTFIASLVQGRATLTFDADGEAKFTMAVPASDAAELAKRLPELMDCSFGVALQPIRE